METTKLYNKVENYEEMNLCKLENVINNGVG